MLEKSIETSILHWLNTNGCFAWKVNNNASTDGDGNFVRQGKFQVSGQPDITCCMPGGIVVFFEVKTATGRQSDKQKAFQKRLEMLGHRYYLVRGEREVQDVIESIRNNK